MLESEREKNSEPIDISIGSEHDVDGNWKNSASTWITNTTDQGDRAHERRECEFDVQIIWL